MKESYQTALFAIVEFTNDLWEVFGTKNKATPLALYRRLTQLIKVSDEKAILRTVEPFEAFVITHKELILSRELAKLPRKAIIPYQGSQRAYLEIEKFIYKADAEVKAGIQSHLLAITAILSPSDKTIEEFEKSIKQMSLDNSPEGQMINDVIGKLKNMEGDVDMTNPMAGVAQLLQDGTVMKLIGGMQQGLTSGDMDLGRLVNTLQGTLSSLSNGALGNQSPKIEEITDSSLKKPTVDPELD